MEEESSERTLSREQLEKLREQMKARYDQTLTELNTVDSAPSAPDNRQFPQPGTWLSGLKRSATGPLQAGESNDLPNAQPPASEREKDLRDRNALHGVQPMLPIQANTPVISMPGTETPQWNAQIAPGALTVQPVPPRRKTERFKPILIIVCLVLLIVAGVSVLLPQMLPALLSRQTNTHNGVTPTPAQPTQVVTPTPTTPPPVVISFEDGGLGSWARSDQDGTISSIKNLSTRNAKDGSHVLAVAYNSNNALSYPSLDTNQLPKPLKVWQTITAYVLKTQGSNVSVSLYVVDQTNTWYKAKSGSEITQVNNAQVWYPVTFTTPTNIRGPITRIGIILFGYKALVYIDAYSWQ